MKRLVSCVSVILLSLTIGSAAIAKSGPSKKYFTLEGKVIHTNAKTRRMIVEDRFSDKLYLVNVPEGATFKITFGINMSYSEPGVRDVRKNDRVRIRCLTPSSDRLAQLEDGRMATVIVAAH
jgi:hypothetical protein